MNSLTRIIRNSAICLIVFCVLSIVAHIIFSMLAYSDQSLSFSVMQTQKSASIHTGNFNFTSSGTGELAIKPTLTQALLLGNSMYKDGGATMVFYLLSCSVLLWITKKRAVKLEDFSEKYIARLIVVVMVLYIGPGIGIKFLLNRYVENFTNGQYEFIIHSSGPFSNGGFGVVIIFNIVYGLIEYTKKLKEETDLTI